MKMAFKSKSSCPRSCSVAQLCPVICDHQTTARQAFLPFTISQSLLKLMSIESVMPSNHLILCHPCLLQPSMFPRIRIFSNKSVLTSGGQSIGALASASVLPMNIQGWFFFRIDWFDLLEPMGFSRVFSNTQLKSINSSVLSFLYGPTLTAIHDYWRNHSFDYVDFFGKVMSLLFNMLSRLVITFLPRNKNLLISWLQSPSAHFGAKENKVCHCFHCFPVYIPWSDGTGCYELSFLNIEF